MDGSKREPLSEGLLYEGVSVDIAFKEPRPCFGDLFLICGAVHPSFTPTGNFGFEQLAELQFDQVDDYFGVRALTDEGDDVAIWLFPLVGGASVEHHPGPFDGVRLEYNILRNPIRRAEHFLRSVEGFAILGYQVMYRSRHVLLGHPPDLTPLRADIDAVVRHWAEAGIEVGSSEALAVDY